MSVSYDRLWKYLTDNKINKEEAGISYNIIAKMGRNECVDLESIYKICTARDCNIEYIIEIIK